jgi:RNA polymerase sigma factor (sigma-70 family)
MGLSDPDAVLLATAAKGDPRAFEPLIARHHLAVHRFVARRIGASEAEDIVSETFEVAFRRAGAFRPAADDARPWLLGIAANLLRRHYRRESKMLRAYARTGVDPVARSTATDAGLDSETERALAGALAEMRREHRETLLLHALGELSYDEIAVALDVPVGTVKGWLHRARALAARHLADAGLVPSAVDTEVSR